MSILRYKFLILDSYHQDTLYLREQGCEDPRLLFEAKRGPRTKKLGKHCPYAKDGNRGTVLHELLNVARTVKSILRSCNRAS